MLIFADRLIIRKMFKKHLHRCQGEQIFHATGSITYCMEYIGSTLELAWCVNNCLEMELI